MKSDLREDQGSLPEESSLKQQKQKCNSRSLHKIFSFTLRWVVTQGGDTLDNRLTAASKAQIDLVDKQDRFSFGRSGQSLGRTVAAGLGSLHSGMHQKLMFRKLMLNFDSILAQKYNWKFAKLYFDEILIQLLNRIQSVTLKRLFQIHSIFLHRNCLACNNVGKPAVLVSFGALVSAGTHDQMSKKATVSSHETIGPQIGLIVSFSSCIT